MEKLERSSLQFLRRWLSDGRLWIGISIIAFVVLRFFYWRWIGPSSFNQDEAALLINAKFLVESGLDEWGTSWPVVFRSFGDAKLPGYVYTVAALGKIVGWYPWLVRVPSFVAGLLLPLALFFNTKQWTGSRMVALCAAFLLVLSPWSWHYGTVGFEANLGLLLFLTGTGLVFWKTPRWTTDILGSMIFFLASMTYNTPWILLPGVGLALVIWRWKEWKSLVRIGLLLLGVFVAAWIITGSAADQKGAITIFQDPTIQQLYPEYRAQFPGALQTLLGNKYVYYTQLAGERWLDSWSWDFLVNGGGANPWHGIPGVGHMHPLIPGLAMVGLVFVLWRGRVSAHRSASASTVLLLVFSLIPSILTVDAPHATRSLFFFIMLTVLAGSGLAYLYDGLCQRCGGLGWWKYVQAGFVIFLVWGFMWWWFPARIRWQRMVSPKWNGGFMTALTDERVQQAEQVFIWDPSGNRYPYVVLATDMSATTFLATVRRSPPDTVGLVRVEQLGKYTFVFQRSDTMEKTGVYLEPSGNTTWNIIEL